MSKADTFVNKFIDIYKQQQTKAQGLYVEDPTVLGFSLWFHFPYVAAHSYRDYAPLFSELPGTDSAVLYLEAIGEVERAKSLRDFNDRLQFIATDSPHYFQSIDGMGGINKFDPTTPFRAFDKKLTINMLESLDMRVSAMIARYMEAVYDFENHRQMVPQNLLNFTVYLKFYEIRNFRKLVNARANDDASRFVELNDSLRIFEYRLEQCTFDFTNAYAWIDSVDNKGGEMATTKIDINVGIIKENHNLRGFFQLASGSAFEAPSPTPDNPNISTSLPVPGSFNLGSTGATAGFPTSILDRAKATAQFVEQEILAKGQLINANFNLKTLALRALNDAFDQLDSRIKGFILGNVFSPLNQLLKNDFYTTVKQFVENVIDKNQTVQVAANNAFGPNIPDHIQVNIDELGKVALAYAQQSGVSLGNVAGFSADTLKALETSILAGSLGNVFKGG